MKLRIERNGPRYVTVTATYGTDTVDVGAYTIAGAITSAGYALAQRARCNLADAREELNDAEIRCRLNGPDHTIAIRMYAKASAQYWRTLPLATPHDTIAAHG